MALTPKHVKQIEESWNVVKLDLQGAGLIMFMKLFEIDPHVYDLFPFKGEAMNIENEGIRKHALQVMETIDAAVGLVVSGEIETLKETLIGLGMVHGMKSVQSKDFQSVGQALVYALGKALETKFTEEVQKTWITLFGIVQQWMEEGMNEVNEM